MEPIRFAFGLHLHQPVGNFDHVFQQHVDDVYLPFLDAVAESALLPISLHVSGPLLDWLESHDVRYLDRLGELVAAGGAELLLAGRYEPVLAALTSEERREQIGWMRESLNRRFGVDPTGLWLTERVWDPGLPGDLAAAGVEYALVDDRHFLASGFHRSQLHRPYRTDADGGSVALFAIDERLRYLIPFRAPRDTAAYLHELRNEGHPLAVLADDGEKFGGWPGTRKWLYQDGWLERFLATMEELVTAREVRPCTFAQALAEVPSGGLAYLPTASYREMEGWTLPPEVAVRFKALAARVTDGEPSSAPLVRGGHWKNFLVRYRESNRMHKKARALSDLCRKRGDPAAARRAIGRAQCNDAYWHGVFGGLYLGHLRAAVWRELARAEAVLREGEGPGCEELDLYGDGRPVLWVHSSEFSAVVSPWRGGAVEELTRFRTGRNLVDVLTRRLEAYHAPREHGAHGHSGDAEGGAATIHELERGFTLEARPPVDADVRALFVSRFLAAELGPEEYEAADYQAVWSLAEERLVITDREIGDASVEVGLRNREGTFHVRLRFAGDGALDISFQWDPERAPRGGRFAPELSLAWTPDLAFDPEPSDVWRYDIRTVSKSERGLEDTRQGRSVTPLWPAGLGRAHVRVAPASDSSLIDSG